MPLRHRRPWHAVAGVGALALGLTAAGLPASGAEPAVGAASALSGTARPGEAAAVRLDAGYLTVGMDAAVTSHGPSGLNVSQFLPLSHWPPRSIWNSRSETSWATA